MSKGTQEAHTPGPWKWDQSRGAVTAGDVGRGVPRLHITPTWRDQDTPESLANARLIAAVPELLAACRRFLERAEGLWDDANGGTPVFSDQELDILRAAIALAESGKGAQG